MLANRTKCLCGLEISKVDYDSNGSSWLSNSVWRLYAEKFGPAIERSEMLTYRLAAEKLAVTTVRYLAIGWITTASIVGVHDGQCLRRLSARQDRNESPQSSQWHYCNDRRKYTQNVQREHAVARQQSPLLFDMAYASA